MNPESVKQFYQSHIEKFNLHLVKTVKKINITSLLRFISIVTAIWSIVKAVKTESWTFGILALILLISFFVLVSLHKNLSDQKKKLLILIKINEQELDALEGNYAGFGNGSQYLDSEHEFTYDLDIFGEYSLFQYINRSCTKTGEKLLAKKLLESPWQEKEILDSQTILKELSQKPDLLEDYRATGLLINDSDEDQKEIIHWIKHDKLRFPLFIKILVYFVGIINIATIIYSIFTPGFFGYFILNVFLTWLIYGLYINKINRYHSSISKKQAIINKYHSLSKVLLKLKSDNLKLKDFHQKAMQSLSILKQLDTLMNFFDTRLNLFVGVVLNTIFLLDFHVIMKLESWKVRYKNDIENLFIIHDEFDALVSMSIYTFNHTEFVWPEISEKSLDAKDIGHPLLHSSKRICSDFSIAAKEKVFIISGANMAGKSTFLRSVGINLILAGIGMKVCAASMSFKPLRLVTGMRTTDSLAESESYFFAELKRLQRIIVGLDNGESYFILLDEILKGTNSTDKHIGSEALIKQLVEKNAITIIATHDLKLGELESSYPEKIKNFHFESTIVEEELYFDYKLRTGIAENMNASFLMKKMGIIK